MRKFLLIIITIYFYTACIDKNKQSAALQKTKQNTIDSVNYATIQQRKTDSLEELSHDTVILKTFEGPAMTPLGESHPKKHSATKRKTHYSGS